MGLIGGGMGQEWVRRVKVSVGGGLETVDTGEVGDQEAPAPGVGETC